MEICEACGVNPKDDNCDCINLMDYFEKSLGDTVERNGDRFIIKVHKDSAAYKFGNGFLINNYREYLNNK